MQKSLKKGFTVESHHNEEEIPGGLAATIPAHSASKRGPNCGSAKTEAFSFQYESGVGGEEGGSLARAPPKETHKEEW